MSLYDSIAHALPELRAQAESLMASTCKVTRPGSGTPTLNVTTLKYDDPAPVTIYDGPCWVGDRGQDRSAAVDEVAAAQWATQGYVVKLPVESSADVRRNDRVLILTNPPDSGLEGREFAVRALHHKTWATSRRLVCTEEV